MPKSEPGKIWLDGDDGVEEDMGRLIKDRNVILWWWPKLVESSFTNERRRRIN